MWRCSETWLLQDRLGVICEDSVSCNKAILNQTMYCVDQQFSYSAKIWEIPILFFFFFMLWKLIFGGCCLPRCVENHYLGLSKPILQQSKRRFFSRFPKSWGAEQLISSQGCSFPQSWLLLGASDETGWQKANSRPAKTRAEHADSVCQFTFLGVVLIYPSRPILITNWLSALGQVS